MVLLYIRTMPTELFCVVLYINQVLQALLPPSSSPSSQCQFLSRVSSHLSNLSVVLPVHPLFWDAIAFPISRVSESVLFSDCGLLAKRPFMVLQSILRVDNLPRRVEYGNGMELASQRTDSGSNRNICSGSAFCISPPGQIIRFTFFGRVEQEVK